MFSPCVLKFNPDFNPNIWTINPETEYLEAHKRPSYIGLAHELIHADRNFRNIHRSQDEMGFYSVSPKMIKIGNILLPTNPFYIAPIEEIQTVGLGSNYDILAINENMIRAEHGLNMRGRYS